jgi:RNase P/RNase MRP subunit p29
MTNKIGSLVGLEVMICIHGSHINGIILQETQRTITMKANGKRVLFPKKDLALILNESKVKGLHLLGLAWNRLKR